MIRLLPILLCLISSSLLARGRSVLAWDSNQVINTAPATFHNFCNYHQVNSIHVQISQAFLAANQPNITTFLQTAHAAGREVYALWGTRANLSDAAPGPSGIYNLISDLNAYNAAAPADGRFDGWVHDIELNDTETTNAGGSVFWTDNVADSDLSGPQQSARWNLLNDWLDVINTAKGMLAPPMKAAGFVFPHFDCYQTIAGCGPCQPMRVDWIPGGKGLQPVHIYAQDVHDVVNLMAYNTDPVAIARISMAEAVYAESISKPLWIYQETDPGYDFPNISWGAPSGGRTVTDLNNGIVTVMNSPGIAENCNVAGWGIHFYAGYVTWSGWAGSAVDPNSDADAMTDNWEVNHGFNRFANDGTGNPDGDALNNDAEFAAGTDPRCAQGAVLFPTPPPGGPAALLIDDYDDLPNYSDNVGGNNDLGFWTSDDSGMNSTVAGGYMALDFNACPGDYFYSTMSVATTACFDASPYQAVRFRVRGVAGGEIFDVNLAHLNACGVAGVTSHTLGIQNYIDVTTSWQTVTMPFSDFVGFNPIRMRNVAFESFHTATGGTMGNIELDDLELIKYVPPTRTLTPSMTFTPALGSSTSTPTASPSPTESPVFSATFSPTPSPSFTASPTPVPGLLIDDFSDDPQYNSTNLNDLGSATDDDATMGPGNTNDTVSAGVLSLTYGGPGEYWYSAFPGGCFDASSYNAIQFDVRGAAGGEVFNVNLKDRPGCGAPANHALPIASYVSVTMVFQTVTILFADFGASPGELDSFVLEAFPGSGSIDIDNLRFVTAPVAATPTDTPSISPSPTDSPSASPSATVTLALSPTFTPSGTATATGTNTASATPTASASPSNTPAVSSTDTPTATPSATISPTPSISATYTPTGTATETADGTFTASPTGTISETFTTSPTVTPTPTITATFTWSPGCVVGFGQSDFSLPFGGANFMVASTFSIAAPQMVNMLELHISDASAGGGIHLGLYDDAAGTPGTALFLTSVPLIAANGWNQVVFPAILLPAGTYWLAHVAEFNVVVDAGPGSAIFAGAYTYAPLPSTGIPPLGDCCGSVDISMRAGFCDFGTFTPTPSYSSSPTDTPTALGTYTASPTGSPTPTITATQTWSPGCATLMGQPAIGLPGGTNNTVYTSRFNLAAANTVTRISVYLNNAAAGGGIHVGLYSDGAGTTGSLVVGSTLAQTAAVGWMDFDVPPTPIAAGFYWLAVIAQNDIDIGAVSVPGQNMFASAIPFGPLPGTISPPPGTAFANFQLSIVAQFCDFGTFTVSPTDTVSPTATLTAPGTFTETPTSTISPTPTQYVPPCVVQFGQTAFGSPGGSADFMVCSPFFVASAVTINQISAYVSDDSLGGGVYFGVYDDAGSSPNNLVVTTGPLVVANGWLSGSFADTAVGPGTFWICYLSQTAVDIDATGGLGGIYYAGIPYGPLPASAPPGDPGSPIGGVELSMTASYCPPGTMTPTPSPSFSVSPTNSPTPTASPTATASGTESATPTGTHTFTLTATPTVTPSFSMSPTITATFSASPTAPGTFTYSPTATFTISPSGTYTRTTTPTPTYTYTSGIPTATPTPVLLPGTLVFSPASMQAGAENTGVMLVYTHAGSPSGSGFTLALPAGWPMMQTTDPAAAGFVTASRRGSVNESVLVSVGVGSLGLNFTGTLVAGDEIILVMGDTSQTLDAGLTLPAAGTWGFTLIETSTGAFLVAGLPLLDYPEGTLVIEEAFAVPNPNADRVWLDLAGTADEIRLRVFTTAYTLIGDHLESGAFRDKVSVPLPGLMTGLANGLYYVEITALRKGAVSDSVLLKLFILK